MYTALTKLAKLFADTLACFLRGILFMLSSSCSSSYIHRSHSPLWSFSQVLIHWMQCLQLSLFPTMKGLMRTWPGPSHTAPLSQNTLSSVTFSRFLLSPTLHHIFMAGFCSLFFVFQFWEPWELTCAGISMMCWYRWHLYILSSAICSFKCFHTHTGQFISHSCQSWCFCYKCACADPSWCPCSSVGCTSHLTDSSTTLQWMCQIKCEMVNTY